ncbi:MAG: NADP-dependent oxidoreductase [Ilumatobacteraceae bacterium]
MRVVGVIEFGGPEALQVVEVPDPPASKAGEVKIRVHAATVNPTDTYMRNGMYKPLLGDAQPPYIPGMDAAGVVLEVGEGVTGFAPGDRVMAVVMPTRREGGAYAEQIVVPAGAVAHAPKDTSHAEAATLPMNGLTARLSLDKLGLQPGQTLAVTGAAGCYGGYMVQLGKADGLRVIADASEADEELVRSLGADVVVRRGDDVAARIREAAPDGVDALADGSVQNTLVLPAVKDGGAVASIRPFQGDTERGITIHMVWVSEYATAGDKLAELGRQADDGVVTLRVARTFAAEAAGEAHATLERGGTRGRLVIEL